MRISRLAAFLGGLLLFFYLLVGGSAARELGGWLARREGRNFMENVNVPASRPPLQPVLAPEPPLPSPAPEKTERVPAEPEAFPSPFALGEQENIHETSIPGGLSIKNETGYDIQVTEYLSLGPRLQLQAELPQILIMHTHGSEAYTPAGLDRYEESDYRRTGDCEYNVVRVGEELAEIFRGCGLQVIHDTQIHDSPSYTGSYTRSGQAVEKVLAENPSIALVIDLHRDALGGNGVIYKTMAEEDGVCASQIMLLVGSDASGLDHPNWQKNLGLALYLQQAVHELHPSLMRPVSLVRERYNQHLCSGSLIVEVGSSGNTLQEALAAIRLFGEAAGPALAALVEQPET